MPILADGSVTGVIVPRYRGALYLDLTPEKSDDRQFVGPLDPSKYQLGSYQGPMPYQAPGPDATHTTTIQGAASGLTPTASVAGTRPSDATIAATGGTRETVSGRLAMARQDVAGFSNDQIRKAVADISANQGAWNDEPEVRQAYLEEARKRGIAVDSTATSGAAANKLNAPLNQQLTDGEILSMVSTGVLSPGQAYQRLIDLGWEATLAASRIRDEMPAGATLDTGATTGGTRETASDRLIGIFDRLRKGTIGTTTAIELLESMGMSITDAWALIADIPIAGEETADIPIAGGATSDPTSFQMVKGEYSTWVFNTEDRDRMLADGWSVSGADPISAAAREEQVIAAVEQQWKNDEFGNDSGRIIDTIQAVYGSDRKTAEGLYRKHRERFPIRDQGVLQRPESRFSEFANYAGIDLQRQGPELNFGRRVGAQAAEVYGLGQGLGERLASVNPSGPQFQTQGFGSYLNTRGGNLADSYAEARSLLQRLDAAGAVGRSESELGFGRRVSEKDTH